MADVIARSERDEAIHTLLVDPWIASLAFAMTKDGLCGLPPNCHRRDGGRSSIPEAPMRIRKSRGLLDTPHAPGMTAGVFLCHRAIDGINCDCRARIIEPAVSFSIFP